MVQVVSFNQRQRKEGGTYSVSFFIRRHRANCWSPRRVGFFISIAFLTQHSERTDIRTVAVRTIPGRRLVEQDKFPFDFAKESVAHGTLHTGVSAFQGKLRAFVVVKL